ncbi:amino acid permease [Arthrobacter crystallopoietes BAB-32]|uniref:Amino acid permease n=1 Tax=Arthrobacter crystallopoietes BAB-32 TaxID=1246476 RepID=N1V6H2_9MICC|nr:amino acid permease [Arthrobacter crystallopoietes]EMY33823.1 amino acid permease [Arthrobacter crystallopoietes BAB-32]
MGTTHLSDDDRHLASFGYKQELNRTLGAFSTFATGFAFISILTGMFLLFGFVYGSGGPASIWAWITAAVGQLLFAFSFAELSVRYPLAGSVYNWTKHVARKSVAWMAGVFMILALVVSSATVGLTMQLILPAISPVFWIYGDGSGPLDASINGVILASIMLAMTTAISLMGAKIRAFVNNVGVVVELVATVVLIVAFLLNSKRGPQVAFETNGTEANFSSGYFGALLVCLLLGLLVMWGFDTAGSLGEETINPRKTSPRAIIRALLASGIFGALLILTAVMSVDDIKDPNISAEGLAYVVQSVLGDTLGNMMLVCAAIAVFICAMANQTGAVNMMFAMARDNALPGSGRLSHVAARAKTPVFPPILVLVVGVVILLVNISQPQIILVVSSNAIIFAMLSYILVAGGFSIARLRGRWQEPEKGYFNLGRKLGLVVSISAVIWAVLMVINVAWPRQEIYNPVEPFHWYLQWGGVIVPIAATVLMVVGYLVQRKKIGIRAEHASVPITSPAAPTSRADLNEVS